ncbi:MAG: hypothetical protein CM15mP120_01310 [Pseudomonadota bacterium]|nr:MAG: hypothetical protein CM15mP120_01310 [Pseudomonadota bacterium]
MAQPPSGSLNAKGFCHVLSRRAGCTFGAIRFCAHYVKRFGVFFITSPLSTQSLGDFLLTSLTGNPPVAVLQNRYFGKRVNAGPCNGPFIHAQMAVFPKDLHSIVQPLV